MDHYAPMAESYLPGGPSLVHVWFGDPAERELNPADMYLAVYAAGGGKRNMANFVRQVPSSDFRTSDVHVFLSSDGAEINPDHSRLFICRWASARGEWVPKEIPSWTGEGQMKLVPEWFKARFWDNKQEKKHPWFMFALLTECDGLPQLFTSNSFPVHQYYPTGVKKTDPNDPACRASFHKVLKTAPPTSLRPEHLLKRAGGCIDAKRPSYPAMLSPPMSGTPAGAPDFSFASGSEDTASEGEMAEVDVRKQKFAAWGRAPTKSFRWGPSKHGKVEVEEAAPMEMDMDMEEVSMEQVGAAEALLSLRCWEPMR